VKLLKSFNVDELECWSTGVFKEKINPSANTPVLQYSSTPILQYSEMIKFEASR